MSGTPPRCTRCDALVESPEWTETRVYLGRQRQA
jgi:hypothetical protein